MTDLPGSTYSRFSLVKMVNGIVQLSFEENIPESQKIPSGPEAACKPKQRKMGKDCIYPQAVRRAQNADMVITNHHKQANLDDEIKKRASVCIIDEADQFSDNLRSALSKSITREEVQDLIRRVEPERKIAVDLYREYEINFKE